MRKLTLTLLYTAVFSLSLHSCCKDEDAPVVFPTGNVYEYLQATGNYTLFLEGVDLSGYKALLSGGGGNLAVLVPDDNAFRKYMTQMGKSSIADFNPESLKVVIGYHLLNFSSNPDQYQQFQMTVEGKTTGVCYKYQTMAQEKPKQMTDPKTGATVEVYSPTKYLPVISTNLFAEQQSTNYAADYKMFFPDINWQGDQKKAYAANAALIGNNVSTDTGRVYPIDKVIELLPTAYDALLAAETADPRYSLFRTSYDRFSNMQQVSGRNSYNFYHHFPLMAGNDLADIAYEWTAPANDADPQARLKYAFNLFVPTDDVLWAYMQKFWDVSDMNDIPMLCLRYLMKAHCANRNTLLLPSAIEKGIYTQPGADGQLKRENLLSTRFCSNGVFYGINKVLEPLEFTMASRLFFQYPRFSTMLNIGYQQNKLEELTDPTKSITMFIVADNLLQNESGYYVDYLDLDPTAGDMLAYTIKKYKSKEDYTLIPISKAEQNQFFNLQIAEGYIDPTADLEGKKCVFYPLKEKFHFVYTRYGMLFDQSHTVITYRDQWKFDYGTDKGKCIVFEAENKMFVPIENIATMLSDQSSEYQQFNTALADAGLTDWLSSVSGTRYIVFAPADNVWDGSKLPTDPAALVRYLKSYFVSTADNSMDNYILPGYGKPGEYKTCASPDVKLKIGFTDGDQMEIQVAAGSKVFTTIAPRFATDGVIFGLTGML